MSISLGETGEAEFTLSFNQGRGQIHVSLTLSGGVGETIAQGLDKDKSAIQQELGYQLTWDIKNNGGEIYITDEGIPIRDQNDWPIQHDWFGDRLEDFQRVLQPRVLALEKEGVERPGHPASAATARPPNQVLAGLRFGMEGNARGGMGANSCRTSPYAR